MSLAPKILIVDDEAAIRRLLRTSLERAGYRLVEAANAREAMSAVQIDKPDAVLLDLGLPDRDGLELVPLIKAAGPAIVVVSAREATEQKVTALDLGADDYVTKPFDTDEVLARVRAALRHRLAAESEVVTAGDVVIDLTRRRVTKAGEEVHLSPKEYGFLAELARHPGRVVTHAQLLRAVWGEAHERDVEYLRVAARGLRRKLEADPAAPALIRNELGIGYRFAV
jgi:two-component system KDP operon response regulator KdpE